MKPITALQKIATKLKESAGSLEERKTIQKVTELISADKVGSQFVFQHFKIPLNFTTCCILRPAPYLKENNAIDRQINRNSKLVEACLLGELEQYMSIQESMFFSEEYVSPEGRRSNLNLFNIWLENQKQSLLFVISKIAKSKSMAQAEIKGVEEAMGEAETDFNENASKGKWKR